MGELAGLPAKLLPCVAEAFQGKSSPADRHWQKPQHN
jgi:hypothetical protein